MDNPFKAGDLATLKSGSVVMTVVGTDGEKVYLAHESSSGDVVTATFPACCLVPVKAAEGDADPRPRYLVRSMDWVVANGRWTAHGAGGLIWRIDQDDHGRYVLCQTDGPDGSWETAELAMAAANEWYERHMADKWLCESGSDPKEATG